MALTPPVALSRAKAMRREPTDAERRLWIALRARRLGPFKFRRQQAVGPFIVDFICIERRLVVELDGGQHATAIDYDEARKRYLESRGYLVLRFWNNDVLGNTEGVLTAILTALEERR